MTARLCLVSDRRRLATAVGHSAAEGPRLLVTLAGAAAAAGVDLVQVREPDLDARALVLLVRAVVAATRGHACRVVVNERVDVAIAAGADGVHLKASSMTAADARLVLPAGALVGRSVHAADEARVAGPVDYLLAGTVYPSGSKAPGAPTLGLDGLAAVCRAASAPVLAIGGLAAAHWPGVAAAGAVGLAGIGLFLPHEQAWAAGDPGAAARAVRSRVDSPGTVP
jgi:thiamine-phosphate pyrophosphorylase